MRKPLTFIVTLLLLRLAVAAPAWAAADSTSDTQDGAGVAEVAHEDDGGVVRYTVTAFDTIRSRDVRLMRWDLDLDADGKAGGDGDACISLRPVKSGRSLRADLHRGCEGDPVAGDVAKPSGNRLKVRFLVDELRAAGLDDDAGGYAYRFRSIDAGGSSDDVPDDVEALISHSFGSSGATTDGRDDPGSSDDVVVGQSSAVVDTPPDSGAPAAAAKRDREARRPEDTEATGTAGAAVVEAGDDVEIRASGFGRSQPVAVSLVAAQAATSTASPSPTSSVGPSQTPGATQTPSAAAQDVADGRAAAAESIGVVTSDDDGNVDDDVDIPEQTTPGRYTILVRGPNATGGTHTVSIPIAVAADVDDASSGDDTTSGQVTNATSTATQAPTTPAPVAQTGTTLPTTGSPLLTLFVQLGTIALLLGGSMLFARRRLLAGAAAVDGRSTPARCLSSSTSSAFDSRELRGEMQRLLALRPHRHDPDRHPDL